MKPFKAGISSPCVVVLQMGSGLGVCSTTKLGVLGSSKRDCVLSLCPFFFFFLVLFCFVLFCFVFQTVPPGLYYVALARLELNPHVDQAGLKLSEICLTLPPGCRDEWARFGI
jgi:hypothetical protein